jgi:hypothetical protein
LRYTFEWDPIKAKANLRKHRITFEGAAELFLDPLAISVFDREHGEEEERWVTVGKDSHGRALILVHTFSEVSAEESKIRIISARKATKREARQHEETER